MSVIPEKNYQVIVMVFAIILVSVTVITCYTSWFASKLFYKSQQELENYNLKKTIITVISTIFAMILFQYAGRFWNSLMARPSAVPPETIKRGGAKERGLSALKS